MDIWRCRWTIQQEHISFFIITYEQQIIILTYATNAIICDVIKFNCFLWHFVRTSMLLHVLTWFPQHCIQIWRQYPEQQFETPRNCILAYLMYFKKKWRQLPPAKKQVIWQVWTQRFFLHTCFGKRCATARDHWVAVNL